MSGPCDWNVEPTCDAFTSLDEVKQAQALDYATQVLWTSTGRRYGLCELVVRPCGRYTSASSLWGYIHTDAGGWAPYLDGAGTWRSCSCSGGCVCRPRCQVWLPGPVNAVTEVLQDGDVVDPSAYRVDDGRWLVRTDGGCWPEHADLSTDVDPFQVTYLRGLPVPPMLIWAAEFLACEFAKAMGGQDCRLPARISSLTRQGVQIAALDTDSLTRRGFVGIPEIDQIIFSLNPRNLAARPQVFTPDIPRPRQQN